MCFFVIYFTIIDKEVIMKKFLLIIFSFLFLINPSQVLAVTASDETINLEKYETKNLKETLKVENIELKNTKYAEDEKQATIYLFRGDGCHYCQNFLNFLNSISEEYGKYFKLVSFEVWSSQANSELMDKISLFMGSQASGVPYIIIGDKVFPGYAEEYDDGIKSAIKSLYESDEKYDVFEKYNEAVKEAKKNASGDSGLIIFFNILVSAIAAFCVCMYTKKQNEKLLKKVENMLKKEEKPAKEENVKKEEKKKKNGKKK